ncbi:MAG: tRNA pseudouridine(55) synthase TruB [Bacillota bacterium]|nr:tRNA pseudouridine(55) synthase TruB [Bacillota bacterium]
MDGILLVDKPRGMTSHDVVFKVRKTLSEPRIGHTGTLDPMASGLLVLCLGKATKLVRYLTEHDKVYEATIQVGIATDTDDITGATIATRPVETLDAARVDAVLASFLGTSEQMPPAYAAIKVDGRKLYEYARSGEAMPDVPARPIDVKELVRTSAIRIENGTATFTVRAHVSKGTYIRALARDFGTRLGFPATLFALRRIRVGAFDLVGAVSLDSVGKGDCALIDPLATLGFARITLDSENEFKARNGAFLPLLIFPSTTETIVCSGIDQPLAIYEYDAGRGVMRLAVML